MLNWSMPEEYIFIRSNGPVQDMLWGIVGFYMIDFLRYWVHRIGHYSFFYKTFPFAHHHHHNQMFMDVTVTFISPLIHLALWATYIPYVLLWSQGLEGAVVVMDNIVQFSNVTQHLGFDPFPWLTKLNHKLCGVIPWVPLYHQVSFAQRASCLCGEVTSRTMDGTVSSHSIRERWKFREHKRFVRLCVRYAHPRVNLPY